MTHMNAIFPRLSSLSSAGKAIRIPADKRAAPSLPRRELQRLIAEMVD